MDAIDAIWELVIYYFILYVLCSTILALTLTIINYNAYLYNISI